MEGLIQMNAFRPLGALKIMLVVYLSFVVVGCDRQPPPGAARAVNSAYVAIARGWVDVEGGLVSVRAQRDGVVTSIHADEGDTVQTGQTLLEMGPQQAQIGVALAQAELAQAQAREKQFAARLPQAEARARRLVEAAHAGAASGESRDDAQMAVAQLRAEAAAARAASEASRQHMAAAQLELDARSVHAPVAGRILRRTVQVGDAVSAQSASPLFQLLPARRRIVRAELDEAFVDRIQPGMAAEILTEADSTPMYIAHVVRIGEAYGASRASDDPADRSDLRSVPCVLTLDDANAKLRIGQRVLTRFLPIARK
jgi:macrolide-specific efflux system membrane fusion protein